MKNKGWAPVSTHGSVAYIITILFLIVLPFAYVHNLPIEKASARTPTPTLSPAFDSKEQESKETPTPTPILDLRSYVLDQFPIDERAAIDDLVMKESSWDQYAVNPMSGACGLFQSINCDYSLDDVIEQTEWGLNYIQQRYGNGWNALRFWYRNGWY